MLCWYIQEIAKWDEVEISISNRTKLFGIFFTRTWKLLDQLKFDAVKSHKSYLLKSLDFLWIFVSCCCVECLQETQPQPSTFIYLTHITYFISMSGIFSSPWNEFVLVSGVGVVSVLNKINSLIRQLSHLKYEDRYFTLEIQLFSNHSTLVIYKASKLQAAVYSLIF